MKTVLQLLLVMLIFGGAATGATLYWQKQQSELQTALQRAEAAEAKANANPLADLEMPTPQPKEAETTTEEAAEPPVAVRPPFVEGVDETSQLVVSLNQRLRATVEKERKLNERQEGLQLIFADIRTEQAEISELRKKIGEELSKSSQSVRDAMKAAQDERDLLRQELDSLQSTPAKTDEKADAGNASPAAKTDSDPAALKRLGAIYDSMPADVVADVLQKMSQQDGDEAVVQILQNMKDRQAAKVLGEIAAGDTAKAAAWTEKLKRR